jgi:predicted dehydrogenase
VIINKILIQGAGSAGARHLRIAKNLFPRAEIGVITKRARPETVVEKNLNFISIEDALKFKPEIAVVSGASSSRIEICTQLANSGIHLLIEKPISSSTKGVADLIDICQAKNLVLAVGYNLRFNASLIAFRESLNSQVIGKPLLVSCEVGQFLPSWRENIDYRQSVSSNHELGGGVLLELSHEIDYLSWVFGKINWVRATVMRQSSLDIDVEDSAFLTLGIENPGNPNLVVNLSMDFIRHDFKRSCVVVGEKGTLKWDGVTQEVSLLQKGESLWTLLSKSDNSIDDSYINEWIDFVSCIDSGNRPRASGIDGLNTLEVIESALESAPTGIQVQVRRNLEIEA